MWAMSQSVFCQSQSARQQSPSTKHDMFNIAGGAGGIAGGGGGIGGIAGGGGASQHTFQPVGPPWPLSDTHVATPSNGTTPAGPEVPQCFTPLTTRKARHESWS